MTRITALLTLWAAATGIAAADVQPNQPFTQKATWSVPSRDATRTQAMEWLQSRQVDETVRQQAEALWAEQAEPAKDLLDLLSATFALGRPEAKELLELCSGPRSQVVLPDFPWLTDEQTPPLERNNLRLLYGRWLAQENLVDEALVQLDGLKPEDVADPAGLLFYQAVVHHRMLNKEPGLLAIHRLMERQQEIPRRYASVARLMQADLTQLEEETLDHIARRMDDIRRRLDLGHAGPKVREVEDGVIESLDKLIEEIEQQQAAAAAAAAAAGGAGQQNIRPSSPAQDSTPIGGKGPGYVDKKNIGNRSGWGDLPPKERQEALQQIGKDFPPHYRDVVEQYFRKLANEEEPR